MEIKKSRKADLEHWRPLMFLAGIFITAASFFLILEIKIFADMVSADDDNNDIAMDLNIKPKDDRDLIYAAEKKEKKEKQENADKLNKVDHLTEIPPEILEQIRFEPNNEEEEELKEDEPINLNDDDPETVRIVQELPEFPGGMVEFMKWLNKNLRYPPSALRNKIEGNVMISFIVNTDGSLSDLKVEKSDHKSLTDEAMRVARRMPKWKPGKDHGKICRTKIAIPIVFAL